VYEKNGDRYFIVDTHLHYWDASLDNWVKGQEEFAKGWIECFHAYMSLGRQRRTGRWRSSRSTPKTT
jgi:uncharacterized protein